MIERTSASGNQLTSFKMLAYVAYAIPLSALPAAVLNLIPAYYAETFGIPLASIGFVFFSLRIFDAITDPLMGWLLDRQPFRQQHKPWILISLPIFLIGGGMLFFPPTIGVGIPYLAFATFLTYAAYTAGLVTHQAWAAALARDPGSLSTLFGYREVAVIVGILCVFLAPAIAEGLGHEGLEAKVLAASLLTGALLVGCTACTLAFAPDNVSIARAEPISFEAIRRFLVRRDFLLLSAASLTTSFAMVSISTLSYFIAAYVFDASHRYGMAMSLHFVFAGVGMMLWMACAKRVGDRKTLMLATGYILVILAIMPLWASFAFDGKYLLFMAALGIGWGAGPYLVGSMVGAVTHSHEEETGESVRGNAYAVTTFFGKLGAGLATGMVLPLVSFLGFDPADGGGDVGKQALLSVGALAPIAGFSIAGLVLHRLRKQIS